MANSDSRPGLPMTNTQSKYDALYCLWEAYLHMRAWGAPEYELLDSDARQQFADLVRTGALFAYVEDCKRDILRLGIEAPDSWLSVISAGRVVEEESLPQAERDRLGAILHEIYLALVRLDPDAHPRSDPGLGDDDRPGVSMNDAVRRAGESLEWVQRERPDLAPGPTTKERYTREQYDHIREHGGPYPLDDHDRTTVPVWDTWSRYVREYLRLTEGRVNFPRRGRSGRSLVRPDELDEPHGDS